jgi:hypothetical protein
VAPEKAGLWIGAAPGDLMLEFAAEREIDAIVYKLFDLTPDEVALLEASIARL